MEPVQGGHTAAAPSLPPPFDLEHAKGIHLVIAHVDGGLP
jgi:hypothetical protein